ncbi:hypothetical protein GCM10010336_65130 [Streptomyces goshikiensis]|nr:hypothetical protein GCM10010336_65130 [Streptomyces goshikiensis]
MVSAPEDMPGARAAVPRFSGPRRPVRAAPGSCPTGFAPGTGTGPPCDRVRAHGRRLPCSGRLPGWQAGKEEGRPVLLAPANDSPVPYGLPHPPFRGGSDWRIRPISRVQRATAIPKPGKQSHVSAARR